MTVQNPIDGRRIKHKVSILERWRLIQENVLHGKDDKSRRYREELLGQASNYEYSDAYNFLSILREKVNWADVDRFLAETDIHTKAKLIASSYIENVIDILQRHDDTMKQRLKNVANRGKGSRPNGSEV